MDAVEAIELILESMASSIAWLPDRHDKKPAGGLGTTIGHWTRRPYLNNKRLTLAACRRPKTQREELQAIVEEASSRGIFH
jgi:hypothetical protein